MYVETFLNKPIEVEYYIGKVVKTNIGIDFLQPFENCGLLKFIGLHKMYNPHHVKSFYYYMNYTQVGIEIQFCSKLIKFHFEEFNNNFGLENKGMYVCMYVV